MAVYEQHLGSVIADERYRQDVSFPEIAVTYGPNSKLGIWVPVEMTERYHLGPANSFAEQNIECGDLFEFRRFVVDVTLRVPNGYD